jgi:hypothetical protein
VAQEGHELQNPLRPTRAENRVKGWGGMVRVDDIGLRIRGQAEWNPDAKEAALARRINLP